LHLRGSDAELWTTRRTRVSNGRSSVFFFSVPYSVNTPLLGHTLNDSFDQIWRKGVPFGTLVQTF